MDKLEKWRGYIPDEELETYKKGGFGERIGMGSRVALLNVDTTFMFVDPAYSMCGRDMTSVTRAVTALTEQFRTLNLPIYYSRRDDRSHPTYRGVWNYKLASADAFQYHSDPRADQWPAEYAPRPVDRIVLKNKPSCFFGTPLESFLRYDGIDTIVVCGISTSGCVRGAVSDAFAHNFRVIVVEEACGDRSPQAHKANMFDMDMKSADVETLAYVQEALQTKFG